MKLLRKAAGYALFDLKRHDEILEDLGRSRFNGKQNSEIQM